MLNARVTSVCMVRCAASLCVLVYTLPTVLVSGLVCYCARLVTRVSKGSARNHLGTGKEAPEKALESSVLSFAYHRPTHPTPTLGDCAPAVGNCAHDLLSVHMSPSQAHGCSGSIVRPPLCLHLALHAR